MLAGLSQDFLCLVDSVPGLGLRRQRNQSNICNDVDSMTSYLRHLFTIRDGDQVRHRRNSKQSYKRNDISEALRYMDRNELPTMPWNSADAKESESWVCGRVDISCVVYLIWRLRWFCRPCGCSIKPSTAATTTNLLMRPGMTGSLLENKAISPSAQRSAIVIEVGLVVEV